MYDIAIGIMVPRMLTQRTHGCQLMPRNELRPMDVLSFAPGKFSRALAPWSSRARASYACVQNHGCKITYVIARTVSSITDIRLHVRDPISSGDTRATQ